MALLFEFLSQQWWLVGALLVAVVLLFIHERRRAGQSVSPQRAAQLINREDAVVVDLRDAGEFRKGHVVGSINIPFASLKQRLEELEAYRERPLLLICKMGQHSGAAGKQLSAAGFQQVYRISGGIAEWQHQQMPLEKE